MNDNILLVVKVNDNNKTIKLKAINESCYTKSANDSITEYTIPVNIRNIVSHIVNTLSKYKDYHLIKEEKEDEQKSI